MQMHKWFLRTFLLFLITVMTASVAGSVDDTRFVAAMQSLHAGKIDEAEAQLLKIRVSDPLFLEALTELQKIRFQKGDWEAFFGNALYYRKAFLTKPDELQTGFRARLLSLESVALAKHCQWDQARALAKASIDLGYSLTAPNASELSELRETLYYIELSHKFPLLPVKPPGEEPRSYFSSSVYWKVRDQSIARIRNPDLLRVKVTDQCGS
jgi:hypothetical protein